MKKRSTGIMRYYLSRYEKRKPYYQAKSECPDCGCSVVSHQMPRHLRTAKCKRITLEKVTEQFAFVEVEDSSTTKSK